MLAMIWDTRSYFFWLLVVSLLCWGLERLAPWRRQQRAWRRQIGQDLFWLVFNGHYAGVLLATLAAWGLDRVAALIGGWPWTAPQEVQRLQGQPLWLPRRRLRGLADSKPQIYIKILEAAVDILSHRITNTQYRDHDP